jgi:hypothetical protein
MVFEENLERWGLEKNLNAVIFQYEREKIKN